MTRSRITSALVLLLAPSLLSAQSSSDFRDEIMRHFDTSTRKFVALAEAMPEPLYRWSPGEGVMEVGQVYMHVARYNFLYLDDNLGVAAPADIEMSTMEEIRDKATAMKLLERSIEHVRESVSSMSEEELSDNTMLYGRDIDGWAVLLQLVAHMNEHLGQSIAYARMNGVVPPWST
jgi:uncharacterized damage-inducible protein DinB